MKTHIFLSLFNFNTLFSPNFTSGNGEKVRLEIEKMFLELFNYLPGFVFIVKENEEIIGVKNRYMLRDSQT